MLMTVDTRNKEIDANKLSAENVSMPCILMILIIYYSIYMYIHAKIIMIRPCKIVKFINGIAAPPRSLKEIFETKLPHYFLMS